MSFSDSDWTSEAAASAVAGRRDGGWIWTLVLGVVIGAAGATLVFLMVERLSQREAHQAVATAPLPATAPAAMPPPPAAVVETAPPAAGRVEPSAASAAASPAAPVPTVPTVTTAAPRPSADELRRKERAWAAYYKRPSSCEGNPTTDQLIECANHFIRSKRDFDERWKAGTL
jgi:hypothetical protein